MTSGHRPRPSPPQHPLHMRRPHRPNPVGVQGLDGVIPPGDVIHVHRVDHPWQGQDAFDVRGQAWVVRELAAVGFEEAVVGGVEADQGDEGAEVGFGQAVADEVIVPFEPALQLVEHGEDAFDRLVVGRLRGGEAGLVDAVVEQVVQARVQRVDVGGEFGRVEAGRRRREVGEGGVEHAQDVGALVVHHHALGHVPEHGHGGAAGDVGVGAGVELMQPGGAEERVVVRRGVAAEAPALVAEGGVDDGDGDEGVEPLERARHQRARGPGADEGDVEAVAPGLGLEAAAAGGACAAVGRDPVAKG